MKFFNIDLHVAVIEDVARMLQELGHEVTSINMSGHNWVFGRQPATGFGPVNTQTWQSVTPDQFFGATYNQLKEFGGFIATYPPSLSQIYERFGKPIICVIPIRYEYPYHGNPDAWRALNAFFLRMHAYRKIVFVANGMYDSEYFHHFTGIKPLLIQSLCEYVGVNYAPEYDTALIMDTRSNAAVNECVEAVPQARPVRAVYGRFQWSDLTKHKALIHIPFNSGSMSFSEHYYMNIPIFVPSKDFLLDLHKRHSVLNEISWNGTFGLQPKSCIEGVRTDMPDPNDYVNPETVRIWMDLNDFYQLPYIIQFSSFCDLKQKLLSTDLADVSKKMQVFNQSRKAIIRKAWMRALAKVGI